MLKIFYHKKAQSLLEYTMLIIIISSALIAMNQYIRRSINATLRQIQLELNEAKR